MAKKATQMKTVKWTDLVNYKKRIPVNYTDEEGIKPIFYLQELGAEDFQTFMNMLFEHYDKRENAETDTEKEILGVVNNHKIIAFVLRKMAVGIDFGNMKDEELVSTLNEISSDITQQINDVLEDLVLAKVNKRVEDLNELVKSMKDAGIDIDGGNEEKTVKAEENA